MSGSGAATEGGRRRQQHQQQPLFFPDLSTPITARRSVSRLAAPCHAAAVSALRRREGSCAAADDRPPPPPAFTLDDRTDFSPEPVLLTTADLLLTPSPRTPAPPSRSHPSFASPSAAAIDVHAGGSAAADGAGARYSPESSSFWLHGPRGSEEKPKDAAGSPGSPVNGVVLPGALITLPPPREVARAEVQKGDLLSAELDEEEWVTVYGFAPGDTNLVLREFEKCGLILKHIPGTGGANWIHILYQNRHDARRALQKNGMQLNGVLIVGVKPLDHKQRQYLNSEANGGSGSHGHRGFMASSLIGGGGGGGSTLQSSIRGAPPIPYRHLVATTAHTGGSSSSLYGGGRFPPAVAVASSSGGDGRHLAGGGAIASPAKTFLSKVCDLMFGI